MLSHMKPSRQNTGYSIVLTITALYSSGRTGPSSSTLTQLPTETGAPYPVPCVNETASGGGRTTWGTQLGRQVTFHQGCLAQKKVLPSQLHKRFSSTQGITWSCYSVAPRINYLRNLTEVFIVATAGSLEIWFWQDLGIHTRCFCEQNQQPFISEWIKIQHMADLDHFVEKEDRIKLRERWAN